MTRRGLLGSASAAVLAGFLPSVSRVLRYRSISETQTYVVLLPKLDAPDGLFDGFETRPVYTMWYMADGRVLASRVDPDLAWPA